MFFCISFSFGQIPPKRELRGAWIATVTNIDWPLRNSNGTAKTPGEQQTDLLTLLDSLKRVGINAVMFQIRPSCDAFYKSSIEPWSEWLTGTQGQAPSDPNYDPLQLAIDACRARGMELHAWFNPYRAVVNANTSTIADNHVTKTKPQLIRDYMSGSTPIKVLDPGEPETRTYVTSVIMDVVRRYDIDAVHFDDYFYPYPVSGLSFPDAATYNTYGGGLPLGDWRRDNVNKLIKMISDSIKAVKPRVKFGISPFGIWRNKVNDQSGSATAGLESYSDIYADSRKWLQDALIDYIAPQIYWRFGYAPAAYDVLAPWWNANSYSRQVFVGHAVHQVDPNGQKWPIQEIVNQIILNRTLTNIKGSIHFSAKYFRANAKSLNDSLLSTVYTTRTLVPRMTWKDTIPPNTPDSLQIQRWPSYASISWKTPPPASDGEIPQQYILYRSTSPSIDFNDMRNVRTMGTARGFIEFPLPPPGTAYYYAVTSLDKNQNESAPTSILGPVVSVEREILPPASFILYQNYPNPFNPSTIISFKVPSEQKISLRVYDVLGREVKVLVDGVVGAGEHFTQFDGAGLSTGVYFYRFVAGAFVESKKMMLVR
ncbi:MAG: family 10 glycosylhydrolase [Ignavibacteriales bacterium]|nr:family 10 glycosylhydrolase [Ignavibacteriales bacterium]